MTCLDDDFSAKYNVKFHVTAATSVVQVGLRLLAYVDFSSCTQDVQLVSWVPVRFY